MSIFNRRRAGGRRRDDDGVESLEFELESVEFVQASDELGLLRVTGLWVAPFDIPLGDIVLNASRGTETLELQRLPDLGGVAPLASPDGEEWRGAFTVPVDIALDPRLELVLVAGEEAAITLPRPGEPLPSDEDPELEPDPDSPVVAGLVAQLDEVARLEDELAETALEIEPVDNSPALAQELEQVRAELDLRAEELEQVRAELTAETHRREALEHELRDLVPAPGERSGGSAAHPADEAFLTRLERARRASETAPSA